MLDLRCAQGRKDVSRAGASSILPEALLRTQTRCDKNSKV